MKKLHIVSKQLLAVFVLLLAFAANSQETLVIAIEDLTIDPNSDTLVTANYYDSAGNLNPDAEIKWHTEPGYLGKVDNGGILTPNHSGEGYLFAKYRELRDSVKLVVTGTPKGDDDDLDDNEIEDDYPKVKIVPGNIKVEVGDSVELYAFYVDSSDVKTDTTFIWSVDPEELGNFPDSSLSMFMAGDTPGRGTVIAQLGELADTVKIEIYESRWKKEKKEEKENHGNRGKQMTIDPGDMVVYTGEDHIQYSATYKTNGNKHQNAEFFWSVSDTSIATIDSDGLLSLTGETGMTLVSVEYSNFGACVELLVVDSMVDLEVNNISIHRVLPNGNKLPAKTFKEGDSYKIGGLPYPLNILNAGRIHFPFGCIDEDIIIYMFIPEEYAEMNDDSTEVNFSDEIITGVKFSVMPVGSDTIVEPFWFNLPIELKLVYKQELLDSLGIDPQDLDVFFADNAGFVEVDDKIAVVDTARNRIYASIAHFSTIVVRKSNATTSVQDLTPISEDMMDVFPNPFSTSATVQFRLADPGNVNISIYNLFGQKVQILADGEYPEGLHKVSWQGKDLNGAPASSGIYLCRFLKDRKVSHIKRMILNR